MMCTYISCHSAKLQLAITLCGYTYKLMHTAQFNFICPEVMVYLQSRAMTTVSLLTLTLACSRVQHLAPCLALHPTPISQNLFVTCPPRSSAFSLTPRLQFHLSRSVCCPCCGMALGEEVDKVMAVSSNIVMQSGLHQSSSGVASVLTYSYVFFNTHRYDGSTLMFQLILILNVSLIF